MGGGWPPTHVPHERDKEPPGCVPVGAWNSLQNIWQSSGYVAISPRHKIKIMANYAGFRHTAVRLAGKNLFDICRS